MTFHRYEIREIYSNPSGTLQYIELAVGNFDNEHFWGGHEITVSKGGAPHVFEFQSNLASSQTANTSVLLATQAFADLGLVAPDFIIPAGFLFPGGGTLNFAGVDSLTYGALPTDGHAVDGSTGQPLVGTPRNFDGATATLTVGPGVQVREGTDGDDMLLGTSLDDHIFGFGGNDTLDGGAGRDTAVLHMSALAVQAVSGDANGLHVFGGGWLTTLRGVERVRFSEVIVGLDTEADGDPWQAEALLWAALGTQPTLALRSQWVNEADASPSMSALAQELLDFYVPELQTSALVTHLFGTVLGTAPTPDELEAISALVGPGQFFENNGELFAFIAALPQNLARMGDFSESFVLLDPAFF